MNQTRTLECVIKLGDKILQLQLGYAPSQALGKTCEMSPGHVTLDKSCSKCLPWLRRQTRNRNLIFNRLLVLSHYGDTPEINSEVLTSVKQTARLNKRKWNSVRTGTFIPRVRIEVLPHRYEFVLYCWTGKL